MISNILQNLLQGWGFFPHILELSPAKFSQEFLSLAVCIFSDHFYFYYEDLQKSCNKSIVGCNFVTSILPLET